MSTTSAIASRIGLRRRINIASRLSAMAKATPDATALVMPTGKVDGKYEYRSMTFAELDEDSSRMAAGMISYGLRPGTRIALLVKPGIDFVSLTFALFKAGAVSILIDPGMGKKNLVNCLEAADPHGFVAIPMAHLARLIHRRRFPNATMNVTVGRRWFWRGPTVAELRETTIGDFQPVATAADDSAAIIFTTGSTGPPKGVLYQHRNFDHQVEQIRDRYNIQPGGIDLAGFPLFGLFNSAMGMTTIIPDMDASRPASVDPDAIVSAVRDWNVTQSFASPAVWNVVGDYCEKHDIVLPTLKRVLSAGAPVPPAVLAKMKRAIADDGEIYTPYGATEALPVASISASEVLNETAKQTADGAGTCVGKNYSGIEWKVIKVVEGPIETIDDAQPLPTGEIGELIVHGPVVTREYVTRVETNRLAKIAENGQVWHRMGDVGYFDDDGRFWFCGRKAHRVLTENGTMYTVCCEAITNQLPKVFRSALVGVGAAGSQTPIMICEPHKKDWPHSEEESEALLREIREQCASHRLTGTIKPEHILLHPSLPVDIRHNAKIFREELAVWAEQQLSCDAL